MRKSGIYRTPDTPPAIDPLPDDTRRPLWSVMIPAYNCIRFLQETLRSVLAQDPGADKMQIEVVDDCSTDGDVQALVAEIGQGRVGFYRQPENTGSLRNFETCIKRSTGHFIHILHGDDKVEHGFYEEAENLFSAYPQIGAAITGFGKIDEHGRELAQSNSLQDGFGIIDNLLYKIAQRQLVQPPAVVVKRSVYEHLGSFFAVHFGEDWEMWVRIAAHYPVAYSPKKLALYRIHTNNISSRSYATGENVKDINKAINIVEKYLPRNKRKQLKKAAKRNFSKVFARAPHRTLKVRNDYKIAMRQIQGALQIQINKTTVVSFLKLYAKYLLNIAKINYR